MSIFNFLKKKQSSVPEWANFFSNKEYNQFIKYVKNYFNNNLTVDENEGVIKITEDDSVYGLYNVAHMCKQNENAHWKEIVATHFGGLIESKKFFEEFSKKSDQFNYAKEYLASRIYPLDHLENIGFENVVCKKVIDDLYITLVYDFPHTIQTVGREDISTWHKSEDELLSTGLSNLESTYEKEIVHQDMGEFKLWLIADSEGFSTNVLLKKEKLEKYIGTKGALIGIPNANMTFIYPIESLEVISTVHVLAQMIEGEYNKPKAISNKLYWYTDERLIEIPFKFADDKINIQPPQVFVDMLNGLSKN